LSDSKQHNEGCSAGKKIEDSGSYRRGKNIPNILIQKNEDIYAGKKKKYDEKR